MKRFSFQVHYGLISAFCCWAAFERPSENLLRDE